MKKKSFTGFQINCLTADVHIAYRRFLVPVSVANVQVTFGGACFAYRRHVTSETATKPGLAALPLLLWCVFR